MSREAKIAATIGLAVVLGGAALEEQWRNGRRIIEGMITTNGIVLTLEEPACTSDGLRIYSSHYITPHTNITTGEVAINGVNCDGLPIRDTKPALGISSDKIITKIP